MKQKDDLILLIIGLSGGQNRTESGGQYQRKKHRNKGIYEITYNHLNLPLQIEIENNRRIKYLYDANGTKLRKYYYENNRLMSTTDYCGMFIYKDDHLDCILTSEGRLKPNDQNRVFYAEYFIKDHLGNVRSVISSNPKNDKPVQGTDYYPFGMEIPVYGSSDNQIKYNSKELQTDAKLDWYDYGARFYDPQLGRWHSVDPLAEISRKWSPYTYCMDNPIRFIDPDGMNVDGYIFGKDAPHAVAEMSKKTSLEIRLDPETGKLSASGKAETPSDQAILNAINDPNITVELTTTNENSFTYKDDGIQRDIIIGAYDGSEITEPYNSDGNDTPSLSDDNQGSPEKVVTTQLINMDHAEKVENGGGTTMGESVIHEFIESYMGAVYDKGGNWVTGYDRAHAETIKLTPQFDNSGYWKPMRNSTGQIIEQGWVTGSGKFIKLYDTNR